jgi:DNA-3-methyladenine glycosylase I
MKDKERCPWCERDDLYRAYHDEEWGVPVYDDRVHFEFLILESAQAGLSWHTVLKKREAYREAFADFDPAIVATYGEAEINALVENPGLIRYRKKMEAAVQNARAFLRVQDEFGSFASYIWGFVDHTPLQNAYERLEEVPAKTEISTALAKDMKKRGFSFLGPTILYAHMQATGLVNDHLTGCFRYEEVGEHAERNTR